MINFDAIESKIWEWADTYSPVEVIRSDDNGPKPSTPYLAIRSQTLVGPGHEYISPPDSSGFAVISGNRDLTVQVQAYGNNSMGLIENLWATRLMPDSQTLLQEESLSLIDKLSLLNITGLNDTLMEERASGDFLFRFGSQTDRTDTEVGLIETVEVDGTYINPDFTSSFTIDSS